ncbi:MAG: DUF711 family protein, partial [Anaerolineae bacterium]|nr:DUF711 family protein [Anaerolineae bacterium]
MQVRAITAFVAGRFPVEAGALEPITAFLQAARLAYTQAGYGVQSLRLATTPFPTYLPSPAATVELVEALPAAVRPAGVEYVAIGPARLGDDPAYVDALVGPLAAGRVFASVEIADRYGDLSLAACRRCARLVREVATRSGDGFGNLYLSALANVPPETPFFPSSYASGPEPRFALAVESADLAVEACRAAGSAAAAAERLRAAIEQAGSDLAAIGARLATTHGVGFAGLDFSLAPYPEAERSLGTAFGLLGGPAGAEGAVAAAALIAEAIDRARFPRAGFSGLMVSLLEDSALAARASEGALTVHDLLLVSAVCGTGLDAVPLPGDASIDALAGVLADVGALALRAGKPLTARLMPLPGKRAGDRVEFDFPYFAPSRVLALRE